MTGRPSLRSVTCGAAGDVMMVCLCVPVVTGGGCGVGCDAASSQLSSAVSVCPGFPVRTVPVGQRGVT